MAPEGHECRIKHHQDIGGSSSRAPIATPKQLAKRRRPKSLHEESSPEDSPPHGGTPESLDEVECLKLRPPVVYTDREVVNYNKVDPRNLVTLRDRPCYSSAKERGTDDRFWTFFHQDRYPSILYNKSKPVVHAQWIHIDYMKSKRDMHFNMILEACEFHGITQLLSFQYNWNQEVITEFYTTLFFDKRERERENFYVDD
jgi:hypothetical protein